MALPTLDATFASAADLPRRQMLAKWLVGELGSGTIADYWSLPERYLWAKIAVAVGGTKTEADYVSLKGQYILADIYKAVSGGREEVAVDMDMKTALGYIAAAYRGDIDTASSLATYIDWPWRYKVASIIDGVASSVITDPYFSNVSLLMHMDGANDSTSFTDSSSNAFTVEAIGDAKIKTSEFKFGSGSAYFDGSGDYVKIQDSSAFNFGSGDFTLECWIRPNTDASPSFPTVAALITTGTPTDSQGVFLGITSDRKLYWLYSNNSSWTPITSNPVDVTISDSSWSHIAWTRSGNYAYLFVNGQIATEGAMNGTLGNSNNLIVNGGRDNSDQYYSGYIDELRITKGVARYTSNFTPPTQPFPNQ